MRQRTSVAVALASHATHELCDLISRLDLSLQAIADRWGCTKRQLQLWIDSDPHRAMRAKQARQEAADWCDRRAFEVLEELPADATVAQVARAREMAIHLRWRARVRNPLTHGDKVQVDHTVNLNPAKLTDAQLEAIAASAMAIEGEAEDIFEDDAQLVNCQTTYKCDIEDA